MTISLARAAALIVAAVLIVPAAPASWSAPAGAADVHGDEEQDRYVGTGGLILPGSVDQTTRVRVAECLDCHWRLTTPCFTSESGHPFDGQAPCLSTAGRCPYGQHLLRAWFRQGAGAWEQIGLACIGEGGPVTVAEAGRRVRERFVQDLDPVEPARQPTVGIVTQLPVLFDSQQTGRPIRSDYQVAGEVVRLAARSRWTWDFGDGATLATDDPGGRFPHDDVAHVYRHAGEYEVTVMTHWTARFTIAGLGPFDVLEPVTQTATLSVPVGEGRAVLAVR